VFSHGRGHPSGVSVPNATLGLVAAHALGESGNSLLQIMQEGGWRSPVMPAKYLCEQAVRSGGMAECAGIWPPEGRNGCRLQAISLFRAPLIFSAFAAILVCGFPRTAHDATMFHTILNWAGQSAVSAALVLILGYLCRNLIETRLKQSVQHEFDQKLTAFKSQLEEEVRQRESMRNTALSALLSQRSALAMKRVEAAQGLWNGIRELKKGN
jgi:hypothetical protein